MSTSARIALVTGATSGFDEADILGHVTLTRTSLG